MEFIPEGVALEFLKEGLQAQAHGIGVILRAHGMEHAGRRFAVADDVAGIEQHVVLRVAGQVAGVFHAEVDHVHAHFAGAARRGGPARGKRPQMLQGNDGAGGNHADGAVQVRAAHAQGNRAAAAQGEAGDVVVLTLFGDAGEHVVHNLRQLLGEEGEIVRAPVHIAVAAVARVGHDHRDIVLVGIGADAGVVQPVVFIAAAAVEQPQHREVAFHAVIGQDHVHRVVQQQHL